MRATAWQVHPSAMVISSCASAMPSVDSWAWSQRRAPGWAVDGELRGDGGGERVKKGGFQGGLRG